MNLISRAIAILAVATVLGGTPLAAKAQLPQKLLRLTNAEELLSRGVDKVETGNYQGAILVLSDYVERSERHIL